MSQKCRLCDREFETIPDGSVQIGRPHGFGRQYQMFLFADHSVHDLKLVNPPRPDTELLQAVAKVLSELPTPSQPELDTAMALAFRKFRNN
jgi:hypothetical protein